MSAVLLSCALFSLGIYGTLTRRDVIGVLASIEVMLAGPLLLLVSLAAALRPPGSAAAIVEGVGVLVLVIAATEAAVGFALLVAVARRRGTTQLDDLTEVRG